jgi:phage terminase small subunit
VPLKPKHASFLKAYISNGHNSAAAARSAGYSERSAPQTGSALLKHPDIAAELARLQSKTEKKLELTANRLMEELSHLAYLDPADLYDPVTGKLLAVKDMPEGARRAIAGIEENEKFTKVRLASKLGSIELAAKLLGILRQDPQSQQAVQIIIAAPPAIPERTETSQLRPEWE